MSRFRKITFAALLTLSAVTGMAAVTASVSSPAHAAPRHWR